MNNDRPGLDDPLWEHILRTRIEPYIPYVADWWANIEDYYTAAVGVQELETNDDAARGLKVRFTRTAVRSPIRGVQVFPFVQTSYLQISGIQGGVNKMIERVCTRGLVVNGFRIIEKHNLPSTIQQGQFIAFIPEEVYNKTQKLGLWLYFTKDEIDLLAHGKVNKAIIHKALLKV